MENKLSKSPERFSFLGQVDSVEQARTLKSDRESDPTWATNNLEYDLRATDWILSKVRENQLYAQHLYAALCNNEFVKNVVWNVLKDDRWSCSWRHAGGIVADMRQQGDYIDWYCSGSGGHMSIYGDNNNEDSRMAEGNVTDEIKQDLLRLGWIIVTNNQ